ncbi:hypothetical protein [Micromonospora gifhornensis]|uniref:Uncharacterized protein n=1 Tax=Micromonospora gifhornensis TaxID=84594 RepID=A0ABQ4I7P4_9ACTN|nr:hypothetical protein [Micromonospora gifhornensis]GIJ13898.1 hypothetical protein Vgi01_05820 [Micromonospora gifhornensis]
MAAVAAAASESGRGGRDRWQCHERGVYETWVPGNEVTDDRVVDHPYVL